MYRIGWEKLVAPNKLAHYVDSEAARAVMGPGLENIDETEEGRRLTLHDLIERDDRKRIVEILYNKLVGKKINYNREPLEFDNNLQWIREPSEIIGVEGHPGQGTCLDLAILFSSLCFKFDLLPLIVLLKGHALVVVSLEKDPRVWSSITRTEAGSIEEGVIRDKEDVVNLVKEKKTHLAVECTGFAYSTTLDDGRGENGLMTFDQATEAGLKNLEKKSFRCAVDIATLQARGLKPYEIGRPPTSIRQEQLPLFVGVPSRPTHFVGRDELMDDLIERLTSGKVLALSAEGLGGVGKTTLAVALAHHRKVLDHFKDGVLWASLGPQAEETEVMRLLVTWAEALGRDISALISLEERQEAVKSLIGQRHFLLVIDDAWQLEAAKALHCGGPNCCHLLTTRNKYLARQFAGAAQTQGISTLDDDSAYELLHALAPEACAADPLAARNLSGAVGGLPLALELLGGYLAVPERSLFPDLSQEALDELTDPRRRLQLAQQRLGAKGGVVTLEETIALSLADLPSDAIAAFHALGVFAAKPERFSRAAAEAVSGTTAANLALLVARNLVEFEGEKLALHQVLADVARTEVDEAAVARHRDYYLALANKDRKDWQQIEVAYGQIRWAWQSITDEQARLDWIWALRTYQRRRGLWRDQLAWYNAGLEAARALGLRQNEGTMLNEIGLVYDNLGQRQKALEYYQQAVPISEEVGDRAGLAVTLTNIGSVYANLGQRQKALEYYQQALPISEEVGDRAGESITRYNMAYIYRAQGRLAEAVVQLRRVIELDRMVQHPDLESDMALLAEVEAELAAFEGGDDAAPS